MKKFHIENASPINGDEDQQKIESEIIQYLSSRYRNLCPRMLYFRVRVKNPDEVRLLYMHSKYALRISTIKYDKLENGKGFKHAHDIIKGFLQTNSHYRFLYVSLKLEDEDGAHANFLLIDAMKKTIERFEPHGFDAEEFSQKKIDNVIISFFEVNLDLKYLPLKSTNLKVGLQAIENFEKGKEVGEIEGYCLPWCLFFLHMRVANPDMNPRTLLRETIREIKKLSEKSLLNFIRSYTKNLYFHKPKKIDFMGESLHDTVQKQTWTSFLTNVLYNFWEI